MFDIVATGWSRNTAEAFRAAFEAHLEETKAQVEVFASLEEKVPGKDCDGIAGIIEEVIDAVVLLTDESAGDRVDASILLTGATGYIGGRLLRSLEERGHAVRCLARQPEKVAPTQADH